MVQRTEQKERTREEILTSATQLVRRRGISGASVSEVMKGAGLTVGGFYAHFDSKDVLIGESIKRAWRQMWAVTLQLAGPGKGVAAVMPVIRRYLSRAHRDHPEHGCVLPAVVSETVEAAPPVREALESVVQECVETLGDKLEGAKAQRRQAALASLALMYGGVSLARALGQTPLSDELLKACRDYAEAALSKQD